jgi:hypothetical protein
MLPVGVLRGSIRDGGPGGGEVKQATEHEKRRSVDRQPLLMCQGFLLSDMPESIPVVPRFPSHPSLGRTPGKTWA